jgi:lysophospholipase L1-like esterase
MQCCGIVPAGGRVLKRLGFSLVVLVAVLGAAEGAARVWGPGLMPADRQLVAAHGEPVPGQGNMVGDNLTGWRPIQGTQRAFGVPIPTHINGDGLRTPASTTREKPAGTRRLLTLGDSSVYGVMLRDTDTIAAQLEKQLRLVDPEIEVLNGGCPGYSSWQAAQALEFRFAQYSPDLVVVATLWSDTQGADEPDSTRYGGRSAPLAHKSAGFVWLRETLRRRKWGTSGPLAGEGPPEEVGWGLKSMPLAAANRVPLGEYQDNLRRIAKLASDIGSQVAFLILPCIRDLEEAGVGDFRDAYREAMREVAAELDAILIDTPAAFVGQRSRIVFLDEVHPTAVGNRIIAKEAATALDGWVRKD